MYLFILYIMAVRAAISSESSSFQGCSDMSLSYPRWEVRDFISSIGQQVAFELANQVTGESHKCDGTSPIDGSWLGCQNGHAFFQYQTGNGTLFVKEAWECSDLSGRRYDSYENLFLSTIIA